LNIVHNFKVNQVVYW